MKIIKAIYIENNRREKYEFILKILVRRSIKNGDE